MKFLKGTKIFFFENFFLQQVTFIYDYNFMQKKVGVKRGQVTPLPLVGVGLDVIMKKLYYVLEKKILHHKLEQTC